MSRYGHGGGEDVGEAFIFVLVLQHLITLEIYGWDGVSPHVGCVLWGQQVQQQGWGRLL